MNTYRLFPKYRFPMAVPVSRPCPAAMEAWPARGTRLPIDGQAALKPSGSSLVKIPETLKCNLPAPIRTSVILADDHATVRQTVKRMLNRQPDFHLAGEADNGLDTLGLIKRLQPDLLVTDLMMPGLNGLEVTRRVRLSFPAIRIVVLSVSGDEPYVCAAFRCGANAFVFKPSCGLHLIEAIRAVLAGRRFVSPPLAEPAA